MLSSVHSGIQQEQRKKKKVVHFQQLFPPTSLSPEFLCWRVFCFEGRIEVLGGDEIPQVKRDKLLLALLPLSGSGGSAGNIYTPNDNFSQLEDISSRFLWARPVWWQKPLHFQGYSQEVWQEPPRKWWLAHEQTPQTGPRETKRPTAWRHHSALNSQSWAICGHLVWAPEGGWM